MKQYAFAKGMPHQRFVFVPQPVMGKSPAELRAYIDGNDVVTGEPVAPLLKRACLEITDPDVRPAYEGLLWLWYG